MLTIPGSRRRLCDGMTRRDLMHVGGLGLLGLPLSEFFRLQQVQADSEISETTSNGFGRAKKCILIHLVGAPPQHETFDPKPHAPAEIQGELKAISSALTGVEICEGLPQTAKLLDRTTIVRSLTHDLPFHHVTYSMS